MTGPRQSRRPSWVRAFSSAEAGLHKWLAFALLFLATPAAAEFPFVAPGAGNQAGLSGTMSQLAGAVMTTYREPDRKSYLDNLFRLEVVAGRDAEAASTIEALRKLPLTGDPPQDRARDLQYEILARAEGRAAHDHSTLADAFTTEFRTLVRPLDNKTSALVMRLFNGSETGGLSLLIDQTSLRRTFALLIKKQSGTKSISLADALALIRAYQIEESYRTLMPFAEPLVNEDDNRRYFVQKNIQVRTPDGAIVCAQFVRPRVAKRLPALLEFGVYGESLSTMSEARRSASNGYVGVTGFTRGKMCSPDAPIPLEHDGADAAALIDWIAKQPWSDGRVGMFSGSYGGFTQWAATKHMPKALKAIMPSVATAPGIDMPMEGSVPLSFNFYWPLYVATNHRLNGAAFENMARWNKLFHDWYLSGHAYGDLSSMAHTPNPIWDRWISHPDYDDYWQAMIPYGSEFANIHIPVLATTGYYDGAQLGAIYYFSQIDQSPGSDHYLLIGPYTHITGQRGTVDVLGDEIDTLPGYRLDLAAKIDMGELRYQWFDYIFKGAPKPAILQDTVNYEVMGANSWRHAPSIAAMGNGTLHFHLSNKKSDGEYVLSEAAPPKPGAIEQKINMADRSDADRVPSGGNVLDPAIDTWLSLEFESSPFTKPLEVSGLFSGTLRFITNKKDFDFEIELYELTPDHKYLQLAWYLARASYVADRSHRHLLVPRMPQQLVFKGGRLMSVKFEPGSRLVAVVSAVRVPSAEINYGTGKDVSRETIADAGAPLDIKWSTDSEIDMPVRE